MALNEIRECIVQGDSRTRHNIEPGHVSLAVAVTFAEPVIRRTCHQLTIILISRSNRHIPSSNGNDEVHSHKQDALKPVGFAVRNEVIHQQDSDEEDDDLEGVEVQSLPS